MTDGVTFFTGALHIKTRQLLVLLSACLLIALAVPLSASNCPDKGSLLLAQEAEGSILAIDLKGEVINNGAGLRLQVIPGPIATKAIRIYSQPSNTLMLLILQEAFAATEAGQQWVRQGLDVTPQATVTTPDLATAEMQVEVSSRPSGDNRVQVRIFGNWPDGLEQDRLISDGLVGAGNFGFRTSLPPGAPLEDPTH